MSDSRNTDVGAVKQGGMSYLTPIGDLPLPTAQQMKNKSERGFHNIFTARMLVPYQRLPDFDRNPDA